MDLQHDVWPQIAMKARAAIEAPVLLLASSLIKDDEGQIKWSSIITGGLTAGLIAAATSLLTMQQTITELRTKYEVRVAQVDLIPRMAERQQFILDELAALRAEKAAATSDRFRGADALRMEERIQRSLDGLDRRLSDLERGRKR